MANAGDTGAKQSRGSWQVRTSKRRTTWYKPDRAVGFFFMNDHFYPPIGILKTCFREKFGVPRQSGMIEEASGVLKLLPDPLFPRAFENLDRFSHIWIVFRFHKNARRTWRPTVEPPRLEALRRVGVFATRSPDRPNPIGLSAVKLDRIDFSAPGGIELHVSGVDILDGTPVLDVKPYLPYADSIADANSGWASREIERYPVRFTDESRENIAAYARKSGQNLGATGKIDPTNAGTRSASDVPTQIAAAVFENLRRPKIRVPHFGARCPLAARRKLSRNFSGAGRLRFEAKKQSLRAPGSPGARNGNSRTSASFGS